MARADWGRERKSERKSHKGSAHVYLVAESKSMLFWSVGGPQAKPTHVWVPSRKSNPVSSRSIVHGNNYRYL